MNDLIELRCRNCRFALVKAPGESDAYNCPACGTPYKSGIDVNVHVKLPARTAAEEVRFRDGQIAGLRDYISRCRAAFDDTQRELNEARAAEDSLKKNPEGAMQERQVYILGFAAATVVSFFLGLSVSSDSTALLLLAASIALLSGTAYHINKLLAERRAAKDAVTKASRRVAALVARTGRLENNIQRSEEHIRIQQALNDAYYEDNVPGMARELGRR